MTPSPGRILVYHPSRPEAFADPIRRSGVPADVRTASTPEAAREFVGWAEVLFCWRFPLALLAGADRLVWIQAMGAGVEDLLGAPGLRPEVRVSRVVDQFGGPMAEYVFAELLHRARRIDRLRALQKERRWEPFTPDTLAGRVMGVAGLGSIGREIVRRARAFDMEVHGLSLTGRGASQVDRHFGPDAWGDFAAGLDVMVLALPLTPATRGAVDRAVLERMRPGALLVNVGRGDLVVEGDLVEALKGGRLGGAVLDVFSEEPLPVESPLWTLPGVTVSPHMSGPTAVEGATALFLENLRRLRAGEALRGLADWTAGY